MLNGNKINENINVVGIKVLEQNGINVNEIIKLLVYNASVEFTAYYYFTNLRMHCTENTIYTDSGTCYPKA
jgi:ferritin-like protein